MSSWKKEESKCMAVVSQMREVQKYGMTKFLAEKVVPDLDDNILYVCKKSIEWRNSLVRQGH